MVGGGFPQRKEQQQKPFILGSAVFEGQIAKSTSDGQGLNWLPWSFIFKGTAQTGTDVDGVTSLNLPFRQGLVENPSKVLLQSVESTSPSGPLRLRVQSRSRTRLRIAASIAFLFRAYFKGVLDTVASLSRG